MAGPTRKIRRTFTFTVTSRPIRRQIPSCIVPNDITPIIIRFAVIEGWRTVRRYYYEIARDPGTGARAYNEKDADVSVASRERKESPRGDRGGWAGGQTPRAAGAIPDEISCS